MKGVFPMEQSLTIVNQLEQNLIKAGFDFQEEMDTIISSQTRIDLPRIKIEHRNNGQHRMYLDFGENYLNNGSQEIDIPDNKLVGVVIAEQFIRALWKENESVPACSSINSQIQVANPIHDNCIHCPEAIIGKGKCKPKVRLLLLTEIGDEIRAVGFNLPPTSIKHFEAHKRKLLRSNLPVIAVNTVFTLSDTKKNGYRWAQVEVSADGIASVEMLKIAKIAREELKQFTEQISPQDYSDPGDKQPF
jgi:hypothetical protein